MLAAVLDKIRPRFGTSYAIASLGIGFIVALVIVLVLHLQALRRGEIARGVERTERLAQAVESHAARTLDSAALTLERVRDQLAVNPDARRLDDSGFRATLQRITAHLPTARIHVLDAQGRLRHAAPGELGSAIDFSRLGAFAEHRSGFTGMRIAHPLRSPATGEWQVVLTSRLDDERGRFGGMLALTIPMRSFTAIHETLRGVGVESVALHLLDGTTLVQSPFDPDRFGAAEPDRATLATKFEQASGADLVSGADGDGTQRIVRYRRLSDWPVLVVITSDAAELRARWLSQVTGYSVLALVVGAMVLGLVTLLIRQVEHRQASERRLRGALDNVTEALAIFDQHDRLVLCTRAFALHFAGLDTPETLVGEPYESITRRSIELGEKPDDGYSAEDWVRLCIDRHANPPPAPWIRRLAGERFAMVSERRLPDGGTVGVISDVTTIKQREQQIELARHDAELANRAKTRFLAAMSHELRTPLNAILGFSEVIRDLRFGRTAIERYASYAGDIHRSGTHLLDLISDILDTSKIEAGRYTLHEDQLDPLSVINEAVNMLRERARNAGVRLRVHVEEELPLLYADERAIRQVLINLLTNAIKFTPKNGRAEIYAAIDEDDWLRIAVGDTGTGIPDAVRPRLFEPFAQAGSAMVRNQEGTGLGLAICRGLVDLHGGTIGIESEAGIGTIVTVRLPPARLRARPEPPLLRAS
ncbi:MAG: PAS-domain containing protein [Alphaproteobacteria bacterium]|nr:PAS-domain containing protein [Alphaproteobacteria bacterium]